MHVSLATFNVIVEIVTEKLNVRNGVKRYIWLRKVSREKYEGDMSYVFGVPKSRKVTYFERGITVTVQHLWSVLNAWRGVLNARASGINELLRYC